MFVNIGHCHYLPITVEQNKMTDTLTFLTVIVNISSVVFVYLSDSFCGTFTIFCE